MLHDLAEMKGTLKVLRGKTYLFKKLDAKGNGGVIGLRSPDTEATLQAARRRKAVLKERLRSLRARLSEEARVAKALRWETRSRLTLAADLRGAGLIGLLRPADRSFDPAEASAAYVIALEVSGGSPGVRGEGGSEAVL